MIQTFCNGWLTVIICVGFLTGCATKSQIPANPAQDSEAVQVADLDIVTGQTIYVPAYSEIYYASDKTFDLAITLTVHNTDLTHSIILTSVRYHNTKGQLVREYIPQPKRLEPLETADFFVDQYDDSGGLGANFIVEWVAEQPVYEPVVEAVMIGAVRGFSFVSPGRVIIQTALSAVKE